MNVVANENAESMLPLLNNATFKGGITMSENKLFYYVMWSHGKILERLLPERLFLEMSSMGFPRNHQFFEVFNKKLEQMMSGGLIDHYTSGYKDYLNPKKYAHLNESSPAVMKLNRRESCFVFWFVSTSFALFGFTLEWFVKLKEYLIMRQALTAFRRRVSQNFDKSVKTKIALKVLRSADVKGEKSEQLPSVGETEETPLIRAKGNRADYKSSKLSLHQHGRL